LCRSGVLFCRVLVVGFPTLSVVKQPIVFVPRCAAIRSRGHNGPLPEAYLTDRVDVLVFMQEAAAKLRRIAHEQPNISRELFSLADDLAREAGKLESELIDSGMLDGGRVPLKADYRH